MREVELPGSGTATSALGYGCSSLMARLDRRTSVGLLEAAFDAGITHFDVARSYGYGEAEGALGEFLRGRRDQLTVATKLGIAPPRPSRGLALAKRAARRAVGFAAPLRGLARRGAAQLQRGGRFGVDEARSSLQTSLRELGADRVDLLLLHECAPQDVSDDLVGFLEGCIRDGSVGSFGIATQPAATRAILAGRPQAAPVVQLANAMTVPTLESMPELGEPFVITHSAVAGGLDTVHRHVTASAERAERWSGAVGADCSDRQALGELMLTWAAFANPDGIVLFSSRDPARIARNAALASPGPRREQAERLAGLVRRELSGPDPGCT